MKRPRKIITRVIILLLLGAIINVAVALGCALWCPVNDPVNGEMTELSGLLDSALILQQHKTTTFHARTAHTSLGTGVRQDQVFIDDPIPGIPGFPDGVFHVHRSGWPLLSFQCKGYWHLSMFRRLDRTQFPGWMEGVEPPKWMRAQVVEWSEVRPGYLRPIPFMPLWPGFAINTLFYAAVLWLLFAAPFALRRSRRIKRGLCPACAYPVGASDVCTECGAAVQPRRGFGM